MNQPQKIAIVGNGPINNVKLGRFIDSCDIVIRFNCFEIEGYEDYVGTKTTIWGFSHSASQSLRDLIQPCEKIWVFRRKRKANHKPIHLETIYQNHPVEKVIVPIHLDLRLINEFNAPPSTGMLGIAYAAEQFSSDRIYVFGFNGFLREQPFHYYWGNYRPADEEIRHSTNAERNYIHQLRQQGIIWNPVTLM